MSAYTLSKEEIREIVSQGVEDAFVRIGIQSDDPIEMQRDFQHLREWRVSMEQAKSKGTLALVGLIITGVATMAWMGFKAVVNGG